MQDRDVVHDGRVTTGRRQKIRAAATVTVVGGSLVVNGQPAEAATLTVTNTDASGPGSLAEQIDNAAAGDEIVFQAGLTGTITLDGSAHKIGDDLTIVGPGSDAITLTNAAGNVLYVYNEADLAVSDITIADVGGVDARAVFSSDGGDLTLSNVTVARTSGVGIEVVHNLDELTDTVTLTDVTVTDAGADGVVVLDASAVEFDGVTVSGAGADGANIDGVVDATVNDSSISANTGDGLGIPSIFGELAVTDSQFDDNGDHGLIWEVADPASTATLTRVDAIGNDGSGVRVPLGGASSFTDIRAIDNGEVGLYVDDTYGDTTLTGVVVAGNTEGGFYVDGGTGTLTVDGLTDSATVGADSFVGNGDGTTYAWSFYVDSWDGDVVVSNVSVTGEFWIADVTADVSISDVVVNRNAMFDATYPQVYLDSIGGDLVIQTLAVDGSHEEGVLIDVVGGSTTIDNLTISNSGLKALYIDDAAGGVMITNSTIADNDVSTAYVVSIFDSDVTIAHSTIADNSSFGGSSTIGLDATSNLVLDHAIVAGNDGNFSHAGGLSTIAEFSLVETGSGLAGTNIETTDPDLKPLGDYGGTTRTMPPNPTSPAVDAGDPAISGQPTTDQRGEARIAGAAIDIGSVEIDGGSLSIADAMVDEEAGAVDVVVTRSGTADGAASVTVVTADDTASAPTDYTATSTVVSWADGEVGDKMVSIPIIADTDVEGTEAFSVSLTAVTGASVGDGVGVVTITEAAPAAISPMAPKRYVDTRPAGSTFDSVDQRGGKLDAGEEIRIKIADRGGVPADAVGVVMNVTAVQGEAVGFVTAHPCVEPRPSTSSLNYGPGVNLGNEIVSGLSASGEVCLYSSAAAHLTVDVVGYIAVGSPLTNVTPKRLLDTRSTGMTDDGLFQANGRPGAGNSVTLQVAGRGGVPDDARTVVVNVTAVRGATGGFVTVSPCSDPIPTASSLNHVAGTNRANELVASLNDEGEMCLFTSADVDLLVDVVGHFGSPSSFTAVAPSRVLDTRPAGSTIDMADQRGGKRTPGQSTTLQIEGRVDIPASATAVVVNVTAVQPEGTGFVTVHPCLPTLPLASSLNFVTGVNGANEVVASLSGAGEICLFTSQATHLLVDVVGFLE